MKNVFAFFLIAILPLCLSAQKEGRVKYKEITKLDIQVPEGSGLTQEQFEAMVPSEQTAKKVLHFNQQASLYEDDAGNTSEGDQEFDMQDGNTTIRIRTISANGEAKVYHQLTDHALLEQASFLGRTFLIESNAKDRKWKLTGATKDVAGYPCQQATLNEDDRTIEVWFTPALPIPTGPDGFINLPGLVLEALIIGENSERKIVAQEVSFEKPEKSLISPPKKGKKVTKAEYDQIVEEKTKEMNQGGGMRIRIGG